MNYSLQCRHPHMIPPRASSSSTSQKEKQLRSLLFQSPFSFNQQQQQQHHIRHTLPLLLVSAVSSTQSQTRKEGNNSSKKDNVQLRLRLDHQVQFGDHVVVLGSAKQLGSWNNNVPLNWTQNGWVCDLEFNGLDHLEFKFLIVTKDGTLLWEAGQNRALNLPATGHFEAVAKWNSTDQSMDLLPFNEQQPEQEDDPGNPNLGHNNNNDTHHHNPAPLLESGPSPFVGEWQGKPISFMRSNDHQSRQVERKWDTSGLQGLPLNFVQGDQSARNWWQKVHSYS